MDAFPAFILGILVGTFVVGALTLFAAWLDHTTFKRNMHNARKDRWPYK